MWSTATSASFRSRRFSIPTGLPIKRNGAPTHTFPFGAGPRRCIGETFAWMEMTMSLATLAQRWEFLPAGDGLPDTRGMVTLRPKEELQVVVRDRRVAGNAA